MVRELAHPFYERVIVDAPVALTRAFTHPVSDLSDARRRTRDSRGPRLAGLRVLPAQPVSLHAHALLVRFDYRRCPARMLPPIPARRICSSL